jgi:hypothetical protein
MTKEFVLHQNGFNDISGHPALPPLVSPQSTWAVRPPDGCSWEFATQDGSSWGMKTLRSDDASADGQT